MTLMARNKLITTIALMIILVEVLGFSSFTLVPTFAIDVLGVSAAGLGALLASRSLGGVIGLAALGTTWQTKPGGPALLTASAGFGLGLMIFAVSGAFAVSIIIMCATGVAAAAVDTHGQALLQRSVDARERGAAMGVWVFCIGLGPIGFVAIGALAVLIGAPAAQFACGSILLVATLLMAIRSPLARLR